MIRDYKNYRAKPKIDWELIILIFIFLFIVVSLTIEWDKEGAELAQQTHVVTDCGDVPMIELDMPIQETVRL